MIKKIKTAALLLICLLLFQGLKGQNSQDIAYRLRVKFASYVTAVPREEIYIQTDRDEYISGEDFWFSVYSFDRQSFKPSEYSKIAYVELLNKENRPIIQKKIWLDKGLGPGQLVLPDTLSTGIYTLRAYTSWMKNFLPYNCFIKDVKVYNAFSNKDIKEKVVSARSTNDGTNTQFYKEGLSIKLKKQDQDGFDIVVMADENYRSDNGDIFYLFIDTHGSIERSSAERIAGERTIITIPGKQLKSGINHITLFDSKGKPVCEAFNYTEERNPLMHVIKTADSLSIRDKFSLDMEFDKRTPANFSISVAPKTNNHSMMDFGDYMVFGTEFGFLPGSVIKSEKISSLPPELMDSLLVKIKSNWINWNAILTDDLPMFIHQVENEDSFLSGKLLLGNQKTADPNKYVLFSIPGKKAVFMYSMTDEEGNFSFPVHIDENVNDIIIQPEIATSNQFLSIESQFSDQFSMPGISVDSVNIPHPSYISAWGVNNQVRKIYGTVASGDPINPVIPKPQHKRFYGKPDNELFMKDYILLPIMQEVFFELLPGVPMKNKKTGYEISMNNPLNNLPYEVPTGLFVDGVFIQDASIIANIDPENVEEIDVVRDKYFVGDYRFYGIVNIITKTGDFSHATLPDYATRIPYRVVDQVPSFVSPDYSSAELKKNRIPDFRNTLYWNPSVKQDSTGHARVEFWTSDFVSDYEINVQGITSEGYPFSIRKSFKVGRK